MSKREKKRFCELLSDKIVKMFGVSKEEADDAIAKSVIQILIDEEPEYVHHVPLYSWAEDVHKEMFA